MSQALLDHLGYWSSASNHHVRNREESHQTNSEAEASPVIPGPEPDPKPR
jgi:hypothetical protein